MKSFVMPGISWVIIKIETYWNVNNGKEAVHNNAGLIKIETYWNVNSFCKVGNIGC